jgi:ADP-ribose pyrophosphatase YjhB (NUDIX family)
VTLFERAESTAAKLPVGARRRVFRIGYVFLQVWWFVRRPHTYGVKVVIRRGDDVLLVRHTYGRRAEWDLPGGFINGDEPPADAALREIEEELGVRADHAIMLGTLQQRYGGKKDTVHAFAADADGGPLVVDEGEIGEARWFARDALPPEISSYIRRVVARAYWEQFSE